MYTALGFCFILQSSSKFNFFIQKIKFGRRTAATGKNALTKQKTPDTQLKASCVGHKIDLYTVSTQIGGECPQGSLAIIFTLLQFRPSNRAVADFEE
jgi:hypothetical protein